MANTTCPAGSLRYSWRSGDTLVRIATAFGTTVSAMRDINPDIDYETEDALIDGKVYDSFSIITLVSPEVVDQLIGGSSLYKFIMQLDFVGVSKTIARLIG